MTLDEVTQFLYREARFADEHQYDAWESLWTADGVYWVPAADDTAPDRHMSIIYDNRSRIALRIKQLKTGKRWAQSPPSSVRRLITNVEILGRDGDDTLAGANFLALESRPTGLATWAGRSEYRLRPAGGTIRMARKKVLLVDRAQPLYTLAFLI